MRDLRNCGHGDEVMRMVDQNVQVSAYTHWVLLVFQCSRRMRVPWPYSNDSPRKQQGQGIEHCPVLSNESVPSEQPVIMVLQVHFLPPLNRVRRSTEEGCWGRNHPPSAQFKPRM